MSELSSIEEKAVELIEKFEALAVDIAPGVIELGLMAARVAAAESVLWLIVGATIYIAWVRKPGPHFKLAGVIIKECGERWRKDEESKEIFLGAIWSVATVVGGVITLANLSIWPFVGIFYPELWIAKQVLGW